MTEIEEILFEDIISIIKDNLQILITNKDSCLYHFKNYCNKHEQDLFPVSQYLITLFTEESLYALLNADFLYDFREIE